MKPFLIITGMHRSGTSFLARALNLCGVYLGEIESIISNDWEPRADNVRGHWENKAILDLTERTLAKNNVRWDDIPANIKIDEQLGRQIKKCTNELLHVPSLAVGFKDPRIMLCLEPWLNYLPRNFLIVAIFRNPLKVAESLKKRNNFDYEKSLNLWKFYNEQLLRYLKKFDGFLLDFDWPKEKMLCEINLILDKLGLPKNIDLLEWYSDELKFSDKTYQSDYAIDKDIKSIHTALKERSTKNKDIKIEKHTTNSDDLLAIIQTLLSQIQKQGMYFKNLNQKNIMTIKNFQNEFGIKESQIAKLQSLVHEKESQIAKLVHEKESQIAKLQSLTQEGEAQIASLKKSLKDSQKTIENIQKSLTWRILRKYDQLLRKKGPNTN